MNKRLVLSILTAAVLIAATTGCNSMDKLSGSGATFPAPFYNIVFKKYSESNNNSINYGAIGSGGGIRNLKDKTVDFGATDVFLSDQEMNDFKDSVLHIPTALGAVVISYNLEGIKDLKLTADLISQIYQGKITHWNDEKLIRINPDLKLSNIEITPVYRSDGSGTTAVFSDYMSKVDTDWASIIGSGKSLTFPAGVAAKGNPGVAGIIAETPGALGYVGSEYAMALDLPSALLQNSSGNFVRANSKSISVSADVNLPADTRVSITNSSNPEAYPISTFTWIIVYKEQSYNDRPVEKAESLVKLLQYVTGTQGQDIAKKTHFAPLPLKVQQLNESIIGSITYNSKKLNVSE